MCIAAQRRNIQLAGGHARQAVFSVPLENPHNKLCILGTAPSPQTARWAACGSSKAGQPLAFAFRSRKAYCSDFSTRSRATRMQFLARPRKPLACRSAVKRSDVSGCERGRLAAGGALLPLPPVGARPKGGGPMARFCDLGCCGPSSANAGGRWEAPESRAKHARRLGRLPPHSQA